MPLAIRDELSLQAAGAAARPNAGAGKQTMATTVTTTQERARPVNKRRLRGTPTHGWHAGAWKLGYTGAGAPSLCAGRRMLDHHHRQTIWGRPGAWWGWSGVGNLRGADDEAVINSSRLVSDRVAAQRPHSRRAVQGPGLLGIPNPASVQRWHAAGTRWGGTKG